MTRIQAKAQRHSAPVNRIKTINKTKTFTPEKTNPAKTKTSSNTRINTTKQDSDVVNKSNTPVVIQVRINQISGNFKG